MHTDIERQIEEIKEEDRNTLIEALLMDLEETPKKCQNCEYYRTGAYRSYPNLCYGCGTPDPCIYHTP